MINPDDIKESLDNIINSLPKEEKMFVKKSFNRLKTAVKNKDFEEILKVQKEANKYATRTNSKG